MIKKWMPAVSMDEGDTYNVVAVFSSEELRDEFFNALDEYYTVERRLKHYVVKQNIRIDPSPKENLELVIPDYDVS